LGPDFVEERFNVIADVIGSSLGIGHKGIAGTAGIARHFGLKEPLDEPTRLVSQGF
jgi:hypothetical protein